MENYSRIKNYVNAIKSIPNGGRNDSIYKIGLSLHGKFGLTGNPLEEMLHDVNQSKCIPPLPNSEVSRIAKSVDASNVPLGDSGDTFERNGQWCRKPSKPEPRIEYAISVSADSVSADALLSKEVSFYHRCQANIPNGTTTIGQFLDDCNGGKYRELVERVRSELDEEKRKELKKELLPAITPNANPQTQRNNVACEEAGRSGIVQIDLDDIPADELQSAIKAIAVHPYVLAVGLSASGTGLFVLIACEGKPDLKKLLVALQADFPHKIDTSRSDVCGLRFATFDENLVIKSGEVFPAILTESHGNSTVSVSGIAKNTGENRNSTYTDTIESQKYVQFPIECFPPVMRDIIRATQRAVGLKDGSTLAIACLAVVSAAIGASCRIRIKKGYEQPAHIFTANVRRSGLAKSSVEDYLLPVLKEKQSEWIDAWETAKADYEQRLIEWKSAKKGERGMPPTEPPPPKRLIVSDITVESIGQRLKENPLGLLLYVDELDVVTGNMGRYNKGRDLPHYIAIHNGSTLTIDRKTNGGLFHVPRPSLVIGGGIQPAILRERLQENPDYFHSGFIARFLIAMPPVEAIKLNSCELSDAEKASYERFITDILTARESMLVDGKVTPQVFPISAGAWNVLVEYQHRHADLSVYETDRNATIEGKFLTNAARIALILHVARLTENGTHWMDFSPISEVTMRNACIITEWFVNEAKRIFSVLAGESADSELTAEHRVVLQVLRIRNVPMTESEIRFANRQTQRIDVERALRELVETGLIQDDFREHEGGGRTAIQYKISDSCAVSVSGIAKNTGENCNSTYTDTAVEGKNADSDPGGIEGLEECNLPESCLKSDEQPWDVEDEEQPF